MSELAVQIVARGPRAAAEAAATAFDDDTALEGMLTYSILEEDEEKGVWRIDAFPTTPDEAEQAARVLKASGGLSIAVDPLADADWLEMALSGLPPVRAGRFFVYGAHDRGRAPTNAGEAADRGGGRLRHRPPRHHRRLPDRVRPAPEARPISQGAGRGLRHRRPGRRRRKDGLGGRGRL